MMNAMCTTMESRRVVRRLQRQDRGAWDELVRQEHRRLFNLHLRLCGDRETAADLTQETFKSAFESCRTFGGRCSARTWLYGVALNVSRNWWRRTGRSEPPEELDEELADPAPDAAAVAVLYEQSHLLHAAVAALPETYRRAVALHYFAGIPSVEIAAAEGVPAGTVRWRLHRALRKLWAVLEPQLKGDLK